jgi:L-aspartate oxidase
MNTDVLIIGSGIASLQLAKKLSTDFNVIILTKSKIESSNSYLAQGGIAASMGDSDDYRKHALDTFEAGRFHNNPEVVTKITNAAPILINELRQGGCKFDEDMAGNLALGMEGAHSENRVVHSGGDTTGKQLMQYLVETKTNNIKIIENVFVYELMVNTNTKQCFGAKGIFSDGTRTEFYSAHTVIATGGCGNLYTYTSSASTITGDGIALAYLAGANISDMEFIQFHPTLLYVNGKTIGLISEAVRGEGARLVTAFGEYVMEHVHPYKDLAPRHIVSQTIYQYLSKGEPVYLDISMIANFQERFPTITNMCLKAGIDLQKGLLPVAPGSHFLMGGIDIDLHGRTNIDNLYAIGEAACTGFHGANRLASNSLLEGLYMGKNLATLLHKKQKIKTETIQWKNEEKNENFFPILPEKAEIQDRMMEYVGIVRNGIHLRMHLEWLEGFRITNLEQISLENKSVEEIEKYFMLLTAFLITKSALERKESRGGHFRSDYPMEKNEWMKKKICMNREQTKENQNEPIKIAETAGSIFYGRYR